MQLTRQSKAWASRFGRPGAELLHGPTSHMWKTDKIGRTPNKLNLLCWNINGFRSVLKNGELEYLMNKLQPDILCVNQTKVSKKIYEPECSNKVKGYSQYWNFSKVSHGYSGVALMSKHTPLAVHEDFTLLPDYNPKDVENMEGRLLVLEFDKCYILTTYVPNAGEDLGRLKQKIKYLQKLTELTKILKAKKPLVVCGDINVAHKQIDLARPRDNIHNAGFTEQQRNEFSKLLESGLIDCYRQKNPDKKGYSWWSYRSDARSRNIGWRVDYFLVDESLKDKYRDPQILAQFMGSDHCPISLELQL